MCTDTEDLYTIIYDEILQPYCKSFTWELQQRMMGRKMQEEAQLMIDELGLPFTPDDWCKMSKERMAEVFPDAKLLPGKLYALQIFCTSSSHTDYD